jgi:hypothetical protein
LDPACFDIRSNKAFKCIINEKKDGYITIISIENFCLIATCTPSVTQFININNIYNVEYVKPRLEYITILEVLPQNYVTSQGFFNMSNLPSLQPTNFSIEAVNVTRAMTRPGLGNVELTFAFRTPIKIPNKSYITYIIPREQ